jgi:hypothetical protein
MPALDKCHDQVVRAFAKEGWAVLKSPFMIDVEARRAYMDVLFSRGTVEVKIFWWWRSNVLATTTLLRLKFIPASGSIRFTDFCWRKAGSITRSIWQC